MRRTSFLILALLAPSAAVSACGGGGGDALDTLPPIKTTSTTTTTTTTPDSRRIFYEVKAGDYLSDIARRYQVTVESIMELNTLTTDTLQVGQLLEIPNDVRLDATLPPLPSASSSTSP
jgi:LysM repeat protein